MPYPQNLQTAQAVEQIIEKNGAVPATIALMDGKIKIGLEQEELELLAYKAKDVFKTSRRDIPYVLSQKLTGATTVSATMIAAQMAGIKIFATGGIGGVHRGAEKTFDISADLQELGKTNVAVISAGIKSILDLGLTMEYLETMGVPVIGYRTQELPAFYTRRSGLQVNFRLDSPQEIADLLKAKWENNIQGGVLITNPVPKVYEADAKVIQEALEKALYEHNTQGIQGKESTPFLLSRIAELTRGKSLETNIKLVLNNAGLAAQIAVVYHKES
jgi:pseudouridine-5'-phosphate glycosidase